MELEYPKFTEYSNIYGSYVEKIVEYLYSVYYKTPFNYIKKVRRYEGEEIFKNFIQQIYDMRLKAKKR